MAVLLVAKIVTFFAFLIYIELKIIRRWDDHLDIKVEVDNDFHSLVDVTPFLTANDDSLHKIFGPNKVITFFLFILKKITLDPK